VELRKMLQKKESFQIFLECRQAVALPEGKGERIPGSRAED